MEIMKASKTNESDLLKFSYNIPIAEFGNSEGEFLINGIAINSTITSNNHQFLPEVLRDSAQTLVNVPLLTDHENMVENIKGRVISAFFDEQEENIKFKAIIKDEKIKQLISDKLLNTVSVGAAVDPEDIEEKDGILIPRNIQFKELSLVAVPADSGATFNIAMKEALDAYKSHSQNEIIIERRSKNMTEEQVEQTTEEVKSEETPEPAIEKENTEEDKEEKEVEEKLRKARIALKKKELAVLEKKIKESDADEEPKEEAKEAPAEPAKEEEAEEEEAEETEEVEESSKYNIVQEGRSFTYRW